MKNEVAIVRKLAAEYAAFAHDNINEEKIKLHKAVNDLHMIRPVVMIDEVPWPQMNINGDLTLHCTDERLRGAEWYFRTNLYKLRHFRADMAVESFFPVNKVIRSTGNGMQVMEKTLGSNDMGGIIAHEYEDQFARDEDLDKLKCPILSYDKETSVANLNFFGEVFGDILPVKLVGSGMHFGPWDNISVWRGVTPLLMDLYERPEFMHKLVRKITDNFISETKQLEALGLLEPTRTLLHCTPASTDDLKAKDYEHVKASEVWGRGVAQIFASVSKEMHDEFDITYQMEAMAMFGLNYYGCCEPLDRKIDIVEKIPNLRKISITPWANVDVAAEAIGKKYVLSNKPNPANVAFPVFDEKVVRDELSHILDACKRNGCAVDITIKDISSVAGNPANLEKWEKVAMELVNHY